MFREQLEFAVVLADLGKVSNAVELFDYMKEPGRYEAIRLSWIAYGRPSPATASWGHFVYSVGLMPNDGVTWRELRAEQMPDTAPVRGRR